jgi:hypothetical protein
MFNTIIAGPGLSTVAASVLPTSSGMLVWDGTNRKINIVDPNYPSMQNSIYPTSQMVSLDPEVLFVLEWAKKKMREEQSIAALMKKHPGLKDLHEKYEVMLALVKEHK